MLDRLAETGLGGVGGPSIEGGVNVEELADDCCASGGIGVSMWCGRKPSAIPNACKLKSSSSPPCIDTRIDCLIEALRSNSDALDCEGSIVDVLLPFQPRVCGRRIELSNVNDGALAAASIRRKTKLSPQGHQIIPFFPHQNIVFLFADGVFRRSWESGLMIP